MDKKVTQTLTVHLLMPDGKRLLMGTFNASTGMDAIKQAKQQCHNSLKRLALGDYRLMCGDVSVPLASLYPAKKSRE